MSEIKVGDLVVQVHDCCTPNQEHSGLGLIGTVDDIRFTYIRCPLCKWSDETIAAHYAGEKSRSYAPLSWLRRIDPLSEPETIEREEETT